MDEYHFKFLKELEKYNTISQRDLSKKLGLSLGKANYIVNALMDKGWIRAKRFKNSKNKLAYMYILTPAGIRRKIELTYEFLKRKTAEYDRLKLEIEDLKREVEAVREE